MIKRKSSEIKDDITSFGKIVKIEKAKRKNWLRFTYIGKFCKDENILNIVEWPKTQYIELQEVSND